MGVKAEILKDLDLPNDMTQIEAYVLRRQVEIDTSAEEPLS